MLRLACCLATLALLALPAPAAERVMLGYYATFGDLPVEQIPWNRLTHLSHAFLRLDADGQVVKTDAMPNAALTADGRKNGVPVLMTVGGGVTVKGLEKRVTDDAAAEALATELLEVMAEGRYDGIDLAWEHPRDAPTRTAHAKLLGALRRGMNTLSKRSDRAARYLLIASLTPTPFLGEWVDTRAVTPLVDWFNVMTYDMSGSWSRHAAHHAPLFASSKDPEKATRSVAAAMRYWETERGLPKSKLVVGAPFFGRSMPAKKPYQVLDTGLANRHRAMAFSSIRKLAGEGWPAQWDNESRAPWLSKPRADEDSKAALSPLTPVDESTYDGPVLIGFDDRNSIHMKTTWAREQGYRGLFFWAIHQDRMPDKRHWLLEAASKAWPAD